MQAGCVDFHELHFTHAVEIEVPMPYVMAGVTSVFTLDPDLKRRLAKMVEERLSEVVPLGWKTVTELREGPPHKAVTAYAKEIDADLLVVAGETQIDLGERVLGGMVERIARHAPCPMLVI